MFFSHLTSTPQEGLFETYLRFLRDERPDKVNLSLGMYYGTDGKVTSLDAVLQAEEELAKEKRSRGYLSMTGDASFTKSMAQLVLGEQFSQVYSNLCLFQTVGASGGLRVIAELLKTAHYDEIFLSAPTWGNHKHIFAQNMFKIGWYPYLCQETKELDLMKMLDRLRTLPKRQPLILHTCCHNPSGVDPSKEQWDEILQVVAEQEHFPIFDFAYQGFGDNPACDAYAIRAFSKTGQDFACVASTSKNFGLYGERAALLMVHSASQDERQRIEDRLKFLIRGNYSSPPSHGAWVVSKILTTPQLKELWLGELAEMQGHLLENRQLLQDALSQAISDRDWSFICSHRGMFSLLGINGEQVKEVESLGYYLAPSGRINVAGITKHNVTGFAQALKKVLHKV